jgi:hypothetical protein
MKKMAKAKTTRDILNMHEIRQLLDELDRPIAFRRALVDLTGSVQSALMLSQAIYWQERVPRNDGWWYKSIDEWQEETGLNRRRLETARKKNRKYLSSDLRDIPARLYWRVDNEALRADLFAMYHDKYGIDHPDAPTQFGVMSEASPAEPADLIDASIQSRLAENDHSSGGNIRPILADKDSQPGGNEQTDYIESDQLGGAFHPNINMYAENTTENEIENKKEPVAEITSEKEAEVETEVEKESRHHHFLQQCLLAFPEEDPDFVNIVVKIVLKNYGLDWVRDAVNEAIFQNDRTMRNVQEILEKWEIQGHSSANKNKVAGFSRIGESLLPKSGPSM